MFLNFRFYEIPIFIAVFVVVLSISEVALSAAGEESAYVVFDNDVAFGGTDENYTYTLAFGFTGKSVTERPGPSLVREYRESLNSLFRSDVPGLADSIETWEIGVTAYTPDDIGTTRVIRDQRPYSSLFLLTSGNIQPVTDGGSMPVERADFSSLSIGFLGIDVAGDLQDWFHGIIDSEDPRGWDNQISEGGELTALYNFGSEWKVGSGWQIGGLQGDGSVLYEVNVGYYMTAGVGAEMRLGPQISEPFYAHTTMPSDIRTKNYVGRKQLESLDVDRNGGAKSTSTEGVSDSYAFAGVALTAVAYNALIQGQFRSSRHELGADDIESLLWELSLGYRIRCADGDVFEIRWRRRSREHKLDSARLHTWGGITYSWVY